MNNSPPQFTYEQYLQYQAWIASQSESSTHTTSSHPILSRTTSSQTTSSQEIPCSPNEETEGPDDIVFRNTNYSTAEDVALFKAWLTVSKDPVIGNEQNRRSFYESVSMLFHNEVKHLPGKRKRHSLENPFSTVNKDISKYVGFLAQANDRRGSGTSEIDVISIVRADYASSNPKNKGFKHDMVYNLVKDHPKWSPVNINNPNTFSMSSENVEGIANTSQNQSDPLRRPPDKKQSKGKQIERGLALLEENKKIHDTVTADILRREERCAMIASKMDALLAQNERHMEQKNMAQQQRADDEILRMNLTGYPPYMVEYWQQKQKEILI